LSKGDPEVLAAVAEAVTDRVRELGWHRRELAARSFAHVTGARSAFRRGLADRLACR
jgi:hypothetical protein